MNKIKNINIIRTKLKNNKPSIGAWMQIPSPSLAEIISSQNFDWVAIDLEHSQFNPETIKNIFRAIELNDKIPFARLKSNSEDEIKTLLECGAGGLIFPNIKNSNHLKKILEKIYLPPKGSRGVGFSRANLYGKDFYNYVNKSYYPIIIPMIENIEALNDIDNILKIKEVDSTLIGPYDLSSSMGIVGEIQSQKFLKTLNFYLNISKKYKKASGIHLIDPSKIKLKSLIKKGFSFIPFSLDVRIISEFYNIK